MEEKRDYLRELYKTPVRHIESEYLLSKIYLIDEILALEQKDDLDFILNDYGNYILKNGRTPTNSNEVAQSIINYLQQK